MKLKTFAACCYLGLVYYASSRVEGLHPLFFPALGAFSYLLIMRQSAWREMLRMSAGAVICAVIGTLFAELHPRPVFLVVDALLVFWMIYRFRWNAPPIMAVSLIPFFSHHSAWWIFPASSAAALAGLTLTLGGVPLLAKLIAGLWPSVARASSARGPNA